MYIGRVDAADADKFKIRRCLRYLIVYKDRTEAAESSREFLHIGRQTRQTWVTGFLYTRIRQRQQSAT